MIKFKNVLNWIFRSFIWLAVLILFLDILSKNLVIAHGSEIVAKGGIVLIPGFLRISYVINQNIAFGISLGSPLVTQIVFSIFAILIVVGIIIFLVKKWDKINLYYKACAMLIIAGALGNVIDRLFYSASYLNADGATGVVDWIDFYGVWKFNFNIADSAVVVGAFMLIIYMIVDEIIAYSKKRKALKEVEVKEVKQEKVLSKTEREKQQLLEESKNTNDSEIKDHE